MLWVLIWIASTLFTLITLAKYWDIEAWANSVAQIRRRKMRRLIWVTLFATHLAVFQTSKGSKLPYYPSSNFRTAMVRNEGVWIFRVDIICGEIDKKKWDNFGEKIKVLSGAVILPHWMLINLNLKCDVVIVVKNVVNIYKKNCYE